jgi:superfamily II DNA or RNA helicase
MIQLRPYQENLIGRARVALRRSRRVLIQLPTGGGKTVLAANMAGTASRKRKRVWFVCHRDFLLAQTSGTFMDVGIEHAFIAAGWGYNPHHLVQVCSVDTLKNRLGKVDPPDMIVWDECHHIAAAGWAKIMAWAKDAYHVGLSATPCRLDGKGLDAHFDELVCGPTVAELMEWGSLSKYKAYAPGTPDLTGLHSRYGDFVKGELEEKMDKGVIIGDMVRHYRQLAMGKRIVYFAVSVKHSQHIAETFCAAGIPFAHIDGTTPSDERKRAAMAFARGELLGLSNVDLFGEGYDLAAQAGMPVTIDAVGLARPTQSLSLHIQQMGRALRPKADGSPAIIIDHAGNITRPGLGFPDDDREWSLEGASKKPSSAEGGIATRQCPECFHIHRPAPVCPACGNRYETASREVEEIDGDLQEIDPSIIRHGRKMEEWNCESEADLVKLGERRGYQYPQAWARRMWQLRAANRSKGADGRVRPAAHPTLAFNDPV